MDNYYEDYYGSNLNKKISEVFPSQPFEMQIGVYLAYYDSLGYNISVDKNFTLNSFQIEIDDKIGVRLIKGIDRVRQFKSRNEAYKEAFKKADKLINKN